MKAVLTEDEKRETRATLRPMIVDSVDNGTALQVINPGLAHSDRGVSLMLDEIEREKGGIEEADPEDIEGSLERFPEMDQNKAPIDEIMLKVSGLLVEYAMANREGFQKCISATMKRIHQTDVTDQYNDEAQGLTGQALNAIAGVRHGYKPARLIYRLQHQTWWDRAWKTRGHDDKIHPIWWRRLCKGPEVRAEDIGYWIIIRGAWHCFRVKNGILMMEARSDIPCDTPPEQVMGDEWVVYEGLPQQRIGDKRPQVIKTDMDLLFAALGYRSGRSNMTFGEWLDFANGSEHSKAREPEDKEEEAISNLKQGIAWTFKKSLWFAAAGILIAFGFAVSG